MIFTTPIALHKMFPFNLLSNPRSVASFTVNDLRTVGAQLATNVNAFVYDEMIMLEISVSASGTITSETDFLLTLPGVVRASGTGGSRAALTFSDDNDSIGRITIESGEDEQLRVFIGNGYNGTGGARLFFRGTYTPVA